MKKNGFTIIELVVVLALFMLIISVTVSIFVSIVQHQKKILGQQELLSQVSYVEEYMSRAIRSAVKDSGGDCLFDNETSYPGYIYLLTRYNSESSMYEGIKFISKDNICQEFLLDSEDNLMKEIKDGGTPSNLLSSRFEIGYVRFIINGDKTVYGASETDAIQPRISMTLQIKAHPLLNLKDQLFQTTISQRNLNTNE